MVSINVLHRPFASDFATGFQLPDGIFVSALGRQQLNAHFTNGGAAAAAFATAYVESTSHPGLVVSPATHHLGTLAGGASRVMDWDVDCAACPPGEHLVSFVAEDAGAKTRSIRKVFVVGLRFDEPSGSWELEVPEGTLTVRFGPLVGPKKRCCGAKPPKRPRPDNGKGPCGRRPGQRDHSYRRRMTLRELFERAREHDPDFRFCPPGYLPKEVELVWTPNPGYGGQYSLHSAE